MKIDGFNIPHKWEPALENTAWKKVHAPYSGASTYFIERKDTVNVYLKIRILHSGESLELYRDVLHWMSGKIKAPDVIDYVRYGGFEYLLMSEISGMDASDGSLHASLDVEKVVRIFARELKKMHQIKIAGCPFHYTLEKQLHLINQKLDKNEINKKALEKEFGDRFDTLYTRLLHQASAVQEDLVFTHGDYCVPNVIIRPDDTAGFIDLADAGIADKYRDFSAMYRSIIRNFGAQWTDTFFDEYGVENLDYDRMQFYNMLEAFAYS